ncbi:MAG TPA: tRNA pseudouridine(55) synthase TruB [Thermoanaerobaculia bacterium]|nr:tRNA pseudouridine(55) synthase TruB [Thermoanaerobaculia bacterium]
MRDGLLLLDKEPGGTSHDCVQRARKILRERRIGHCGTLDPDATGLLVLTVGRATRLTRFFIRAPKVYTGEIQFGAATNTYDASGEVQSTGPIDLLTEASVREAMEAFVGPYEQTPPPFSAKKVGGVRYYELARRGEEVPHSTKVVTIYELAATSALAEGRIAFRLAASSGTYARSVAHDLGQRLECGAHLAQLRRLKVGPFSVDDAWTLSRIATAIAEDGGDLGSCWIPFDEIPLPFPTATADGQQERRLLHGQSVLFRDLEATEGDWIKLIDRRQRFLAVGTVAERIGDAGVGVVQPKIVFK